MIDMVSWLDGRQMENSILIILNQDITRPDLFDLAWDSCAYRVVTDGAANRLLKLDNAKYIPDLIVGDFDSISAKAEEFYKHHNVPFVQDTSVYATDFMKAMKQSHLQFDHGENQSRQFIAFGAMGGRVDHTWHSYFCLSVAQKAGDELVLVSDENITVGLTAGEHTIKTPQARVGITCGYAPLEGDSLVATKGFEWDVEDFETSFTTQLSTSNHLKADEVWIKTTKSLMFTVEIK